MKKPNKDNPSSKKTKDNKPNFPSKGLWLYVLFIVGLFVLLPLFNSSSPKEISWSYFEQNILAQNDVEKIIVVNREIAEIYIKKERLDDPKYDDIGVGIISSEAAPQYAITIGSVEGFENKLEKAQDDFSTENKVHIVYQNRTNWLDTFSWILPFVIIILFWLFILRRMGSRGGMGSSPFNFSKTSARIIETEGKSAVTFNDVAGLKEAKVEVMEVVDFLKNPETYTKLGAKIPKGVMLEAHQAQEKPCWLGLLQAKQKYLFSRCRDLSLLRCLLVLVPLECAIYLNKLRAKHQV